MLFQLVPALQISSHAPVGVAFLPPGHVTWTMTVEIGPMNLLSAVRCFLSEQ